MQVLLAALRALLALCTAPRGTATLFTNPESTCEIEIEVSHSLKSMQKLLSAKSDAEHL